jgi:hypothetical protein
MSSYLNRTFYQQYLIFDKKEMFLLLNPFIYSDDSCINKLSVLHPVAPLVKTPIEKTVVAPLAKIPIIEKTVVAPLAKIPIIEKTVVAPENQSHSFFWCLYILHYGSRPFHEIKHKYGNVECEEKLKIVEYIKQTPSHLKKINQKITKSKLQEIMSELLTCPHLSIYAFSIICLYYDISIYIVNLKTNIYYHIGIQSEGEQPSKTFILHKTRPGIYKIDMNTTPDKINNIQQTMVLLESPEKAFKSLSAYKVCDLIDIATRLHICHDGKLKKAELYERICKIDTKI